MGYIIESNQNADSGLYTPILGNVLNAVTAVSLLGAIYSRNGNVVNVTISGSVDLDFLFINNGEFSFTLPFPTTSTIIYTNVNFLIDHNVNGVGVGSPNVQLLSNNFFAQANNKFVLNCTYEII